MSSSGHTETSVPRTIPTTEGPSSRVLGLPELAAMVEVDLSTKDRSNLSRTSRQMHTVWRPKIMKKVPGRALSRYKDTSVRGLSASV